MRTVATAPVFGRDMRIASVQEYFSVPETIDGITDPERRYAVVTVVGHNGGLLPGVITPLDSIFIDTEELNLAESFALSDCAICREMQPLRCDRHA